MQRRRSRFSGVGFGTLAAGNYDAPDTAILDERPGAEHGLSRRFVADMEQPGKYLIRR